MRTKAHRVFATLGFVLLALGLVACGSGGSGTSASPSSQGPIGLVLYNADPANEAALISTLKPFEQQHGVTVKVVSYPYEDFLAQFSNIVRSGSQIDLLLANGQDVRTLQSKNLLAPLDDVVDANALVPAATAPFLIGGHLYAAGMRDLETSGLIYNKELVTKYGLTIPQTFADIKADVQKLKGTGVALIAPAGADIYLWPMWLMQTIQQASGDKPDEFTQRTLSGEVKFTDPVYVNALQAFADLSQSGAFVSGFNGLNESAAVSQILQKKAVMFYGGTWDISTIAGEASFPVDMAQFPTFFDVASKPVGGSGLNVALYGQVDSSRRAAAQDLVKYFASVEGDEAFLKAASNNIWPLPVAKGANVPGSGPSVEVLPILKAEFLPYTFTYLDWFWPKSVTSAAQQSLQALAGGRISAQQAAQNLEKAFNESQAGL